MYRAQHNQCTMDQHCNNPFFSVNNTYRLITARKYHHWNNKELLSERQLNDKTLQSSAMFL